MGSIKTGSGFIDSVQGLFESDDYLVSKIKPSEWAGRRVMSSDVSAFAGPFSYDRTPYLREVVDCFSPDHPARTIAVMKGAQIGFSTGVIENAIGWIIAEQPGPILMLTGSTDLSKQSMDTKIDQMIDSCGIRHMIRPNTLRAKNQRTGDTSTGKEFAGGRLQTGQTGNHKKLRQISMQYGFVDDFEAAPRESHQSGSTRSLIEMRFSSYYEKMKLAYISTPEIKQTSNIEPAFLEGDQRFYNVPCPCCGDYIDLQWTIKKDKESFGMTWKLDKLGRVIPKSVGYICQSCGDWFNDGHKYEINLAGKWVPTATPDDPSFYSYNLNALYAPPGMYDWEYYVRDWMKANPIGENVNVPLLKTFYNTVLAKTWEERGEAPKSNRISTNTRPYSVGVIPNQLSIEDGNGEIVLLTCACDLNGKIEDARIDYEITGYSETGASYSIDHDSIGTFIPRENTMKNKVDRERWSYEHGVENSVWPEFLKRITASIKTDQEGREMRLVFVGVDTGHFTQYAYEFIEIAKQNGLYCIGLKGKDTEKMRMMGADTHVYKQSRESKDLYLVEVNQLKNELAEYMKLRWVRSDGVSQPIGFMNFPTPEKGKYTMQSYFSHYESEHKVMDKNPHGQVVGFRWIKRNSNVMNHLFDCRVYNNALREIASEGMCKEAGIKYPSWRAFCDLILGKAKNV